MHYFSLNQRITGLVLFCTLITVSWMVTVQAARPFKQAHVYKIGVVPQFAQRKLFKIWVPIIERLEKETGLKFELAGSYQIPDFEKKFMAGDFDFAYMNPYHVVYANSGQGYIPLVRDGSRVLRGIIVVRKDGVIDSVKELNNKSVAYPSAKALGASLLPRSELLRKFNVKTTPVYVKTHSSVYLHVAQGLVVAGGGVLSTLDRQKLEVRKLLRILYYTQTHKPHPLVAHPRVPITHIKKVQRAFLNMAMSPSGRVLLEKIPMKKVVAATMSDYESIKNLKLRLLKIK